MKTRGEESEGGTEKLLLLMIELICCPEKDLGIGEDVAWTVETNGSSTKAPGMSLS